jgi:hypothetical protein
VGNIALHWYFISLDAAKAIRDVKWQNCEWYEAAAAAVPYKLKDDFWRLTVWDDGYFVTESRRFETSWDLVRSGDICMAFVLEGFLNTFFKQRRCIFGNIKASEIIGFKLPNACKSGEFFEMSFADARNFGLLSQLM